jgi:ABC-type phosphate transport system substrate-binding protein
VVSRGDESGTTAVLQGYLAAEGGWTGETSTTFAGRSSQAVQGTERMLTTIENTEGAIGYLQSSDGTKSRDARLNGVAPDLDAMAAAITAALPDEGLVLKPVQLYRTKPADGAYPLVSVGHALSCAGDPAVRDFLLASLNAQRDETAYLFPTGEWAERLVALLQ